MAEIDHYLMPMIIHIPITPMKSEINRSEGRTGGISGTLHEPKKGSFTVHGHKKFVFPNHENKKVRYSF